MTLTDLLRSLRNVRQSGDRHWKACCPAHDDAKPSLGVTQADDGKIVIHCHAGCTTNAVVEALGLTLADLFEVDGPNAPAAMQETTPATALPLVAAWLRDSRRIADHEIARMHARETRRGAAVAFVYEDIAGHPTYTKYRLIAEKAFWRSPAGSPSMLYGLSEVRTSAGARVIVTEGELDAQALRAAGFSPVVSLPDGAGSRLTPELLAPLAKFTEVLIATDADAAGDTAAVALALALGSRRCRRVRFSEPGAELLKDAGDALKAGWTHEQFEATISMAEPFPELPAANDNGRRPESAIPYRVIDGVFCHVRTDRQKNETIQSLANFSAFIDEQITRDDGTEATTHYKISGRLATGEALPPIMVPSIEYPSIGWVSKWGHGPTVYAGNGKRDHVRVAIDLLSKPTRRCIYAHTGWRQIAGKWAYLFHGGAVGADDVSVVLDPPLDRVVLPERAADPVEAVRWSLRLLSCAPLDVMVPLLGAVYAAPLSFILNPDCTIWLVGTTGSYKSELATLAQRHFGDFERTSLPVSWCGTEAAIEYKLSAMKDMVCVVDDFAPQPDIRSQQDQAKRAEHIIRNVGNRSSRDRMRADLSQRPSRPPRGLLISTGEDLPASPSIQARLIPVQVDKDRVDLKQLTALQQHGYLFAHAMRAFLENLRPEIDRLRMELPAVQARAREHFIGAGAHARQPSGLALLYVGLDLALQFAVKIGAIDREERRRLTTEGRDALMSLGARQARDLEEIDPAQRYIEILREELAQGRAVLCDQPTTEPRGPGDAEVIGYRDAEYAYLLPEASRKRVSASLRAAGEAWSVTPKTLHTSLLKKRIVLPGSEGRPQTKRSFGGTRVRVLTVPLSILWDRPPAPDEPAPAAPPANENGAGSARQTPWLNKSLDEAAPPAPGAPHLRPLAGGSLVAEEE